ncbi:hypothetical protein BC829DRAFT_376017 [Chytridium lagenaria]|nr:hypothetical protein BC829DRAFT_376017 [Chytridium lagenaria]
MLAADRTSSSSSINSSNSSSSMSMDASSPALEAEQIKAQANLLYKEKEYSDAIELYSKCIELQPSNPTYYGNRSAAYTMLKKHAESVLDCRTSLNMDSTQIKVYSRAAKGLLFMGDTSAAADMIRSAIAAASADSTLSSNLYRLKEDLDTAIKAESYVDEAISALKSKEYAKGLKAVEHAITHVDPSVHFSTGAGASKLSSADLGNICPKWKLLRADALLGLRELPEAGKIIQSLLFSDSTNSEALAVRAEILFLNDTHAITHVQQVLQQALAFDPDNKRARAFLKRIKLLESLKKEGNDAFGAGNWAAALDAYTRYIDEDTDGGVVKVKVLSNRSTVRSKLITFGPVSPDSHSATSSDCRNSNNSALFLKLYLRRSDSSLKLEKYDEAIRDYTFADGLKPGDREIQNALRQTQNLQKQAKRKDYYKILEVDRGAGESEIKKAYRRLALREASIKFKEISEAYSVLSDPRKKDMFDSGMDVDGSSASAGQSPFGHGGFGGDSMEDIMRVFMGAGMGGMGGGFPGHMGGGRRAGHGHQHGGGYHFG